MAWLAYNLLADIGKEIVNADIYHHAPDLLTNLQLNS
jgi:hypothetical protein